MKTFFDCLKHRSVDWLYQAMQVNQVKMKQQISWFESANLEEGQAIIRADVSSAVKEADLTRVFADDRGSASVSRTKELGVEAAVTKHEQQINRTRRMASEHRTVVVSLRTPMKILKRRREPQWTCLK